MIELGPAPIRISWWHECSGCTGLYFRDALWARLWLARFQTDSSSMSKFRLMLVRSGNSHVYYLTDDEVVEQLASLFCSGQLHVCEQKPALVPLPIMIGKKEEEAPPFSLVQRRSTGRSTPLVAEAPAFPSDVDVLAVAEAQKEAASLGIPFCEECEKARLKAAAGGPS